MFIIPSLLQKHAFHIGAIFWILPNSTFLWNNIKFPSQASMASPVFRAHVCSNAVRNPVGYVKPVNQNTFGNASFSHLSICSIRRSKSIVHEPCLRDGYANDHIVALHLRACHKRQPQFWCNNRQTLYSQFQLP